jgi:predicted DNA-binding transcriptional regulator AlpA
MDCPIFFKTIVMSIGRAKKSKVVEQRYISVSELAMRWSVSPSAIYARKCGTNALTPIRLGRSVRFLRKEIEAFEMARERQIQSTGLSHE